ncbi:F0F1 ATP synthase subunit gamma [Candidatus Methylospira mobilis]|uniref:F0F1 ATP synthase subunit gamma n=1 Tax=Candidatus Methylospira mobilis TaxID=1808979 RepID=A0A5Q0BH75_9GAMM|nr:F0F1 ATP synthase subunit gamma [Candidatus Methylospira mobilis]QFY41478.1 F0F1 ATP synthase subunit gamma [Candidatus Methylospira mobilis]
MSLRREIDARLNLYDDLSGILGAMRSFALAELHRVGRNEAAQQLVVQSLSAALDDLAEALPAPSQPAYDIWLLFGSVRGFCGSFNEDVIRAWRNADGASCPTLLFGERLHGLVGGAALLCIGGANGGLDAPVAIDRILAGINELRRGRSGESGLIACIRDDDKINIRRLLPLPGNGRTAGGYLPLTHEPAPRIAAGVAEHYLFHNLLALLLRSIRVENHMRLMQMETALRHLEQGSEELKRQRNRLRQEEIVEEIELMIGIKRSAV